MSDTCLTIQHIKKRKDFLYISDHGVSVVTPAFVVKCVFPTRRFHVGEQSVPRKDGVRIGYVIRKKIGNAVTRNFVRRRLREMVRADLPFNGIAGCDYVVIARNYSVKRDFFKMRNEFVAALKQLTCEMKKLSAEKETATEQ